MGCMDINRRRATWSITYHIVELDAILEAKLLKLLISCIGTLRIRPSPLHVHYESVSMALLNCMCVPEPGTACRGQR